MEFIFYFILLVIARIVIEFIINFFSNLFHSLEVKLEEVENPDTKEITFFIKAKGRIPVSNSVNFISMVFDITDGERQPVLCFAPNIQNKNTYWFEKKIDLPYEVTELTEWVPVGIVLPTVCVFPKSKKRELEIVLLLADQNQNVIKKYSLKITYLNNERGYSEIHKIKNKLFKIELQILMSIAMSDGIFDSLEGHLFTKKIRDFLDTVPEDKVKEIKEEINQYLKKTYEKVSNRSLNLKDSLDAFKEISTNIERYELIKNCTEMMNADKLIQTEEIELINKISKHLELDFYKVNSLKDIHILQGTTIDSSADESLLGIKTEWNLKQKQDYLKKEFIKWNSRMQNCSDEKERIQIQKMINLITKNLKDDKEAA